MTKDEMKNRISMALKNPILQQGFEIICKENAELEKENAELKARLKYYSEQICNKECAEVWGELTEAKEIIEKLLNAFASNDFFEKEELCAMAEAEQFLEESDNEKA